ncbi:MULTISPECIES: MFS transporter [unclassified Dyella]|uniref:MFS transporter n=1 Tax=unclassified Dyella TaxID=2634549 RepID=UPI000C83827E|nr:MULTISPECIES: MFS transporter [unclassified Dyella]MDR3444645.1 MFS transporter [Dyella sp.]PMQ06935.1 Multidrug resistance protein Stp [Dyella sp. AD56]
MNAPHSPPYPSGRSQRLVLASVCLAAIVLPLSFSGGAIATPDITRQLGGTSVALTWVTNAFMLSFGSLLMAAGALADQYGRKRVFAAGMALFLLSSILLALAPTVFWLDVLRAMQGVAAAAALSGGSAALAQEFEGHARTRAFGLLGTSFGLGLAFGPVIAGSLIAWLGWRAIFAFIAVIASVAMSFGLPRMRETRDPAAAGLDWPGTLCFTAMLVLLTFGIIQAPIAGWSSPLIVALLAGAGVLLLAFIMIEARVERPMLDLSLFRYPRFIGVQMLPVGTCYCYIVLVVLLPLRLIGIEGWGEMRAGLFMLALSAPLLFMPLVASRLAHRVSPGLLSGLGFLIAAAGLIWLARTSFAGDALPILLPLFLIGSGAGIPWGLMDGLAISVVPKERAGMATGIFSTTRVAGEGIALASVGAMLAWIIQSTLSHTSPGLSQTAVAAASQQLATGELRMASNLLHPIPAATIKLIYADAFHMLLLGLAAITVGCAITVFWVIGAPEAHGSISTTRREATDTSS